MKATRIFLLGFAAAVMGLALASEPVAAQCWSCGPRDYYWDGKEWVEGCAYCTGDTDGAGHCSTPSCGFCIALGPCRIAASLDGRSAAPATPRTLELGQPSEAKPLVATFASADHSPIPPSSSRQTLRSCDGGITAKWYSAGAVHAARGATARLRL